MNTKLMKHTTALARPRPRPRPRPRYDVITVVPLDSDAARHTRHMQLIGMLFALSCLVCAILLLAYAIILRGV